MNGIQQAPTRSAVLELKAERLVVGEAYDFLDEKRLLLAAELLRQLADYDHLRRELEQLRQQAVSALAHAVAQHGLQGLSVYPAAAIETVRFDTDTRNFMGVMLADTRLQLPEGDATVTAACPTSEARACQLAFRKLLEVSSRLAGTSGNLYRLLAEYRLTERRARALENVILPEIEQALRVMTTHLEELEFEDTVRVRVRAMAASPA
ncbi:MAG: V-type ATP synthase subunit D [Gammaproteobacteria bacterium]|nr:V-type ATP synthase subunit D [Gammaproteobacteria bacterium]